MSGSVSRSQQRTVLNSFKRAGGELCVFPSLPLSFSPLPQQVNTWEEHLGQFHLPATVLSILSSCAHTTNTIPSSAPRGSRNRGGLCSCKQSLIRVQKNNCDTLTLLIFFILMSFPDKIKNFKNRSYVLFLKKNKHGEPLVFHKNNKAHLMPSRK